MLHRLLRIARRLGGRCALDFLERGCGFLKGSRIPRNARQAGSLSCMSVREVVAWSCYNLSQHSGTLRLRATVSIVGIHAVVLDVEPAELLKRPSKQGRR